MNEKDPENPVQEQYGGVILWLLEELPPRIRRIAMNTYADANKARRIVAQVAVEAVVNNPSDYDDETRSIVLRNGFTAGVSDFYLDMLREIQRNI